MQIYLMMSSKNSKTGNIPQSYSPASTCPITCPLQGAGCYGDNFTTKQTWRRLDSGDVGIPWDEFLSKVREIEVGRRWRHNVVGDLVSDGTCIDLEKLDELVKANRGRRGFTYTHHPLTNPGELDAVANANARGLTINLSADSLSEADRKAALGVAPVVTLLPSDSPTRALRTPEGRKVIVCPAQTHEGVTCLSCGLCARVDRPIIGFRAHGTRKRSVDSMIAKSA